jgi:hypothetical protein
MENKKIPQSELLAYTIEKIKSIEWARRTMYVENDIYKIPIQLVFRFSKDEKEDKYVELKKCIELFNGNIEWILYKDFYSRKNYVIEPIEFYKIKKIYYENEQTACIEDVMKEYKVICDKAVKDIPLLCQHIEIYFNFD